MEKPHEQKSTYVFNRDLWQRPIQVGVHLTQNVGERVRIEERIHEFPREADPFPRAAVPLFARPERKA